MTNDTEQTLQLRRYEALSRFMEEYGEETVQELLKDSELKTACRVLVKFENLMGRKRENQEGPGNSLIFEEELTRQKSLQEEMVKLFSNHSAIDPADIYDAMDGILLNTTVHGTLRDYNDQRITSASYANC